MSKKKTPAKAKAAAKKAVAPKAKAAAKKTAAASPPKKTKAAKPVAVAAQFNKLDGNSAVRSIGLMPVNLIGAPLLDRPEVNPRQSDLNASVSAGGQMAPALVVPISSNHPLPPEGGFVGAARYRVFAGHSRLKAAVAAKKPALVSIMPPFATDAEEMLAGARDNEMRGGWGEGKTSFFARCRVISDLMEQIREEKPDAKEKDVDVLLKSAGFTDRGIREARWVNSYLLGNGWRRHDERVTSAFVANSQSAVLNFTEYFRNLYSFAAGDDAEKSKHRQSGYARCAEAALALAALASLFDCEDPKWEYKDDDERQAARQFNLQWGMTSALQALWPTIQAKPHNYDHVGKRAGTAGLCDEVPMRMDYKSEDFARGLEQKKADFKRSDLGSPLKDGVTLGACVRVATMFSNIGTFLERQETGAAEMFLEDVDNEMEVFDETERFAEMGGADLAKQVLNQCRANREHAERRKAEAEKAKAEKKSKGGATASASSTASASAGGDAKSGAKSGAAGDDEGEGLKSSVDFVGRTRTLIAPLDARDNPVPMPGVKSYLREAELPGEEHVVLPPDGEVAMLLELLDYFEDCGYAPSATPKDVDDLQRMIAGEEMLPNPLLKPESSARRSFNLTMMTGLLQLSKHEQAAVLYHLMHDKGGRIHMANLVAEYGIGLDDLRRWHAALSLQVQGAADYLKDGGTAADVPLQEREYAIMMSPRARLSFSLDFSNPKAERGEMIPDGNSLLSFWRVPSATKENPTVLAVVHDYNGDFEDGQYLLERRQVQTHLPGSVGGRAASFVIPLTDNEEVRKRARQALRIGAKGDVFFDKLDGVQLAAVSLADLALKRAASDVGYCGASYGLGGHSPGEIAAAINHNWEKFFTLSERGLTGAAYEIEQILRKAGKWDVASAFDAE